MNRKIEIAKKKRSQKAQERSLIEQQIASQESLKNAVHSLYKLLNGKKEYDFTVLEKQLSGLDEKLNFTPIIKSLEKSVKTSPQTIKFPSKTKIEGFSELLSEVKNLKLNPTIKAVDTVQEYRPSDMDIGDGASYYGFLHPTGKWYIMRKSGATTTIFRYAYGTRDYSKAWTNRTVHDYNLYNEVTL